MKKMRLFASVFVAVLLSACAKHPPLPPELQYQEPVQIEASATLVGSQENSSWADDFTAFVWSVDGKRAMAGRKGWNQPLRLEPGPHRITVVFARGAYSAMTNLQLVAQTGMAYQIKYVSDVGLDGSNTYCEFWIIEQATGKVVVDPMRANVVGGGGGSIPIFIPVGR